MPTVALPSIAMAVWFVESRGGLPPSTTGFVIESVSDLILFEAMRARAALVNDAAHQNENSDNTEQK
jgi:hypothetical protein